MALALGSRLGSLLTWCSACWFWPLVPALVPSFWCSVGLLWPLVPALVPSFCCPVWPLVPGSRCSVGWLWPPWLPPFGALCAGSGPWFPLGLLPFGALPPPLGFHCLGSKKTVVWGSLAVFFLNLYVSSFFHWGWRILEFRARAGGGNIFLYIFLSDGPISNLQSKQNKLKSQLGQIGRGRPPPPDDFRALPLTIC